MKNPRVEEIARAFCNVLNEWLSEIQIAEIRKRNRMLNRIPKYAGCCATHDFCDANEAMEEAFNRCGVSPLDTGIPDTDYPLMSEEMTALWNAAWSLAKSWQFFAHDFVVFIPKENHDLNRGNWISQHNGWSAIFFQDAGAECRQMMVCAS